MRRTRFGLAERLARRALALGITALVVLAPGAQARPSSQSLRLADLVNGARSERSLQGLDYESSISSIAHQHSVEMDEAGELRHSTDLPERVEDWTVLGETIGVGGNLEEIFQAFMDSSRHRAHILKGEYEDVGVGVYLAADDTYWVTMIFRG